MLMTEENTRPRAGIINPRAPDPTSPASAAGHSGWLSVAIRLVDTCQARGSRWKAQGQLLGEEASSFMLVHLL